MLIYLYRVQVWAFHKSKIPRRKQKNAYSKVYLKSASLVPNYCLSKHSHLACATLCNTCACMGLSGGFWWSLEDVLLTPFQAKFSSGRTEYKIVAQIRCDLQLQHSIFLNNCQAGHKMEKLSISNTCLTHLITSTWI